MILGTWQQLAAETDDLSISSDSDTVIEKTLNIYASPSFSIIRAYMFESPVLNFEVFS